jgi:hypothetical protein
VNDCRIEPTKLVPDSFAKNYNADETIFSSLDDGYLHHPQNIFRKSITVGNCGQSTINFSQFLSCLGLTVQQTTTLTATFTETIVSSSGYTTFTVAGCTPAGFPYVYCSESDDAETESFPFISMGIDGSIVTESSTYPTTSSTFTTDPDKTPFPISVSFTASGESLAINFPPVPETVDSVHSTTGENTENFSSTFYPPHFQEVHNDANSSTFVTNSADISTVPYDRPVSETVNNDNNAVSTTNESPTYPFNSTITIHNDISSIEVSTGVSSVSIEDSYEIQIRPPVFTTVPDESSTTIDDCISSVAINNMDSEVNPAPLTNITDQGDSTIYPSVSVTVEGDDTTEEGLT